MPLPLSAPIARVSLEKQAKSGYSLETQIRLMTEINAREGYATSAEYVLQDDGFEGDDWDRPAINQGLELLRTGKVKALTFMETDRFSRDVQGGLALIKKVKALGGNVILGDLGVVRDEHNFQLMLHVKLAVSQFQKASTKVKSRDAVITKIRRGEIHGGRAPYGYLYLDKRQGSKLIVNAEQAKVIRQIYRWYDLGWSLRRIVRELIAQGIQAPGRPRKDGVQPRWNPSYIRELILNETYTGTWHYNKYESREPERIRSTKPRHRKRTTHVLKDRDQWIPVPVEAIVDREIFDRCLKRLETNPYHAGGCPSDRYTLKGLLWCSCGHRMHGARRHKRSRVRACSEYEYRYDCTDRHPGGTRLCSTRVKAEPIEELVWREAIAILTDESLLRRLLTEHDKNAGKRSDRAKLEERIAELFQTEMRYRADSGRVTGSKAREIREGYAKLITETASQREILERELAGLSRAGDRVDVGELVALVRKAAANANRTQRQEILQRWVARVDYHGGVVTIDLLIPLVGAEQKCWGDQPHPNSFAHLILTRRLAA